MARTGRKRDHRDNAADLAKAIHAAIISYNREFPREPFAIDDATSRILANDPDYHPPRKRLEDKNREPTQNPGIFTVRRIAEKLGVTVGELLREKGFDLSDSDLRTFRWMSDYLRTRFPIDELSTLADDGAFIEHDLTRPVPLQSTKLKNKGKLAAGPAAVESDFEITEAEIIGTFKGPGLVTAQVKGRSMADRYRDGDTIVIDTSRTIPKQHEPVAVYIENEGGVLGYWRAEAGKHFLDKHNSEVDPIPLGHPSEWRVLGVIVLVQSRVSRQDRPPTTRR